MIGLCIVFPRSDDTPRGSTDWVTSSARSLTRSTAPGGGRRRTSVARVVMNGVVKSTTWRRASVMTEARVSVNNLPKGRRASVMTEARVSVCKCEQLAYGPSRVRDDRGT